MGSKGSLTSNTAQNQSQSYVPTGGGYTVNALNQGQAASQLPFNVPQAPVQGFSNDQLQAFQNVDNAQGMAQPYFNQAQNYFNQSAQGPNISQFFNPYASAVTDQLKNIYGQQMSQATGQLTQAAGGVGADRIAVGQGQLANQQDLAAGQTLAGIYGPSLQAAQQEQNIQQGAGYGLGALGPAAQNAAFSGAQQQLTTGGLQQQLGQAQLNSGYQQQLAQSAFPYQQAQFNAGITGSLAPQLGGITAGSGTGLNSQPGPSWLSTILGGGLTGAGLLGALGVFGANRGGRVPGYADGGSVDNPYVRIAEMNQLAQDDRSLTPLQPALPSGVSGRPMTGTPSIIPTRQGSGSGQSHQGNLNFNLAAPAAQNPDAGMTSLVNQATKLLNSQEANGGVVRRRGGRTHFVDGGDTSDAYNPYAGISGLSPEGYVSSDTLGGPLKMATEALQANTPAASQSPQTSARSMSQDNSNYDGDTGAVAASPRSMSQDNPNYDTDNTDAQTIAATDGASARSMSQDNPNYDRDSSDAQASSTDDGSDGSDAADDSSPDTSGRKKKGGFMRSPWLALTAAGLGMMASKSPFAGQAFGEGGLQGIKMLEQQREAAQKDETIDQAARHLDQEAEFHRNTAKYQQGELSNKKQELQLKKDMLTGAAMSDAAVDLAVDRIKAGDPRAIQNLGRGAQSGINLTRIQNRLAERAAAEGWSGGDIAAAQANFSSQAAAARTAAIRESNVASSIHEAENTFPLVKEASAGISRGKFVPWNELVQSGRAAFSDPALAKLQTAIQGARTAYSQAMSRTGVNTVHAQQAADHLLSSVTDEKSLYATLDQMAKEMAAAKAAPEQTRQEILARISGRAAPAATAPAGAAAPTAAAAAAKPVPTASDIAYAKANPNVREKFIARFGVEP